MAKLIIVGDVAVISSVATLEQLKQLEKYNPKALTLYDGDGNETFKVGTGSANINAYGVSFNDVSKNGDGLATLTVPLNGTPENVVKFVADKYGTALVNLNKIEAGLTEALDVVSKEQAEILSNIVIM